MHIPILRPHLAREYASSLTHRWRAGHTYRPVLIATQIRTVSSDERRRTFNIAGTARAKIKSSRFKGEMIEPWKGVIPSIIRPRPCFTRGVGYEDRVHWPRSGIDLAIEVSGRALYALRKKTGSPVAVLTANANQAWGRQKTFGTITGDRYREWKPRERQISGDCPWIRKCVCGGGRGKGEVEMNGKIEIKLPVGKRRGRLWHSRRRWRIWSGDIDALWTLGYENEAAGNGGMMRGERSAVDQ
ncbi:hypothetical protein CONPUDRAFT_76210 [Coniophora puteana RWD-64-598 SS2]|uniref:Uncharacterized protein n=1 Tax=Coniophora puteana (strain RWD-64-598) TaxID=741705 RepID=A0A5M3MD51_CONPW|nr:uncharacterized protein CONPUDRAFT_76210 [Coniophora puteana RWD-64-598 SS2]EIW76571.1 hypothetical protein CONPUDRAFT_76210 [Coniophora puteana RWD-64-598 SS2]